MMTEKYDGIEIPGLPEGWKPVAYRNPKKGEWLLTLFGGLVQSEGAHPGLFLIVEKLKPKRIVLEYTGEIRRPEVGEYAQYGDSFTLCRDQDRWGCEHEIWRKVKEDAK